MECYDDNRPDTALAGISEEDELEFEKAVSQYPSSFHLETKCLTRNRIKALRNNLFVKCKNKFIFVEEKLRLYNLISYLSARLEDFETALDFNTRVLQANRNNGIALANRARFNRYSGNFYDSKKDIEKLQKQYEYYNGGNITTVTAKCELAWSCARFGPKYHN